MKENGTKNIKEENKKEKYKVIKTYSENGDTFQNVMEAILINKLKNI